MVGEPRPAQGRPHWRRGRTGECGCREPDLSHDEDLVLKETKEKGQGKDFWGQSSDVQAHHAHVATLRSVGDLG